MPVPVNYQVWGGGALIVFVLSLCFALMGFSVGLDVVVEVAIRSAAICLAVVIACFVIHIWKEP